MRRRQHTKVPHPGPNLHDFCKSKQGAIPVATIVYSFWIFNQYLTCFFDTRSLIGLWALSIFENGLWPYQERTGMYEKLNTPNYISCHAKKKQEMKAPRMFMAKAENSKYATQYPSLWGSPTTVEGASLHSTACLQDSRLLGPAQHRVQGRKA